MRLFFTQTHIINLDNVSSVNLDRGVVNMVNGNEIRLSDRENRDIKAVMEQLHSVWCEQNIGGIR
jgi:hypothetical protein